MNIGVPIFECTEPRSIRRKGNCWYNAVAEMFFKTLKMKLIYQNKY